MQWTEYQTLASRTFNMQLNRTERLENAALGLIGEAGEIADLIKKHRHHGHPLDRDKVIDECGDLLWYVAQMCSVLEYEISYGFVGKKGFGLSIGVYALRLGRNVGIVAEQVDREYRHIDTSVVGAFLDDHIDSTLDEAQQRNIEKLRRRYPNGFSSEASLNRAE
jgi:NTP pyrophosphatase (non-canonical NTP hydrolase)